MENQSEVASPEHSIIRSKQLMDRISSKISTLAYQSNRTNAIAFSLESNVKKIQDKVMNKIEDSFSGLLHSPTMMSLEVAKPEFASTNKENTLGITSMSSIDGTKALMYHYWDKYKKSENQIQKPSSHPLKKRQSQSKLPSLNVDNRLALFIKGKEKEKQLGKATIKQDIIPIESFHCQLEIVQFQCQNQSKKYLLFQKSFYKNWQEIEKGIIELQRFTRHYSLEKVVFQTKTLMELIERYEKINIQSKNKLSFHPHDVLACFQKGELISQNNKHKSGIRFYGFKGKNRAIVLIQSHFRKVKCIKLFKIMKLRSRKAIQIQRQFRIHQQHNQTREIIFKNQLKKLQLFKQLQKGFCESYRKNEISKQVKYEIHLASKSLSEWQKVTINKYSQGQNTQLCRVFRLAKQNNLIQTRIIYISPIQLPSQIVNYYKKLFQFGSEQKLHQKLHLISPVKNSKLPTSLSLSQQVYYCSKTLQKIKSIIRGHYAYIIPSMPSNDYVLICNQLKIPLYGSSPQELLHLQTKAGSAEILSQLASHKEVERASHKDSSQKESSHKESSQKDSSLDCRIEMVPFSMDIYNGSTFVDELSQLIVKNPLAKKWILKIDNEVSSRGIAQLNSCKIIGKRLSRKIGEINSKHEEKVLKEEIHSVLQMCLIQRKEERIVPLNREVYPNQQSYLNHYFTRGGTIELALDNLQTQLQTNCFTYDIQPDGHINFLSAYTKVTDNHRTIGCYYHSRPPQPHPQIQALLNRLVQKQMFGFFTFQFFTSNLQHESNHLQNKNSTKIKPTFLNSIQCHLNDLSSVSFLRNFISADSHVLYIPLLMHPALKDLRIQTFFHLCRIQNISFDIQRKIGNIFTFIDGLKSGCVGVMTFNSLSKEDCFESASEVVQFLNTKLNAKDVPKQFYSIKNAINGYLHKIKRKQIKDNV